VGLQPHYDPEAVSQVLNPAAHEASGMKRQRNGSERTWAAALAILICLVLILVPHLPLAAAGVSVLVTLEFLALTLSPELVARFAYLTLSVVPDAPVRPPSFQRPPPFTRS
jgi:uncharacterized membrane protein YgaE (UPF0421/DUF939 family)